MTLHKYLLTHASDRIDGSFIDSSRAMWMDKVEKGEDFCLYRLANVYNDAIKIAPNGDIYLIHLDQYVDFK